MGFAPNAKKLVDVIGWSDREVSRRLKERGVKASPNTVGRWLSGSTEPSVGDARVLADLIGESLDVLTDRNETEYMPRPNADERAVLTVIRARGLTLEQAIRALDSIRPTEAERRPEKEDRQSIEAVKTGREAKGRPRLGAKGA